jgi:hypothetical protein
MSFDVIPEPLNKGQLYYVGVVNPTTISLHLNQLDAEAGINPIALKSIVNVDQTQFVNSRNCDLKTIIFMPAVPPISLDFPNEVTFLNNVGDTSPLPAPLLENVTYFVQALDNQNLEVYASIQDATARINPLRMSGNDSALLLRIRKPMTPITKLTFPTPPGFITGDSVNATTGNNGVLPQPLLENQTYFVHQVAGDPLSVTLHLKTEDAATGDNPINLITQGSGPNAIAKVLPASVTTGTVENVTANNFTLAPAQGTGAHATALATGPVTSINLVAGGANYTSSVAIFDDTGGYDYNAVPTVQILGGAHTRQATASCTIATDTVTGKKYVDSVAIIDVGAGYDPADPPYVIFTGGLNTGGVPASAYAIVQDGAVVAVTLQPYGSGAAATVSINTVNSEINGLVLTNGGDGYAYPPRVNLTKPNGSISSDGQITILTADSATYPAFGPFPARHDNYFYARIFIKMNYSHGGVIGKNTTYGFTVNFYFTPSELNDSVARANRVAAEFANKIQTSYVNLFSATVSENVISIYSLSLDNGVKNGHIFDIYTVPPPPLGVTLTTDNIPRVGPVAGQATATATVTTSFVTQYAVTDGGSGYIAPPAVKLTGGGGIGASAVAAIRDGKVSGVTVVTKGTGYTSAPAVSFLPATGVFVQFTSTGTLPSPLVQGVVYRAEAPAANGAFTLKNADFTDVNITDRGTGNLYMVLSRAFAVGFTDYWTGDFKGLTNGQQLYFGTDYSLPLASPSIDSTSPVYVKLTNATTAQFFNTYDGTTFSNQIKLLGLGAGQTYYALQVNAFAKAYKNLLIPETVQYLVNGMKVFFSSTGALPYPIQAYPHSYTIQIIGNSITLTDELNRPVVFTQNGVPTLAAGQMHMNIVRDFRANPSTTVVADASLFDTGQEVSVRANYNDRLPTGLHPNAVGDVHPYFVRRISANEIAMFDTKAHALNLVSETGLISLRDMGDNIDSQFLMDLVLAPALVKQIYHIEKPKTLGYVSLYAFDYGRSQNMTLIGQYHPDELNPKYRRIRIGKKSAWARILYRVKAPVITSVKDYIPLENTRAILAALHAVDLEDKDFMEQSQKYWAQALNYLRNQNESMEGHAMMPPQINNISFGDGTDDVMF